MLKEKKRKKEKLTLLGIEPMALIFNELTVVLAYLNTLQRGGNALGC
jgi:hypothetical protein